MGALTISKERLSALDCVMGLDCSKYQKDINWKQAKSSGIDFAFVKVTEGTTGHEDNIYNLKARVLEAQKNGVKVGYYHFARPGNVSTPEDDASEEVQNVLSHIAFLPKVQLPLVLDIESYSTQLIWNDKQLMNRFINTFISQLKDKGIDTIVYSYKSFIDSNTVPAFGGHPLWIAAYLKNPETTQPAIPNGWHEWKIWQFTDTGRIVGHNGDLDLNIMKKSYFNLF